MKRWSSLHIYRNQFFSLDGEQYRLDHVFDLFIPKSASVDLHLQMIKKIRVFFFKFKTMFSFIKIYSELRFCLKSLWPKNSFSYFSKWFIRHRSTKESNWKRVVLPAKHMIAHTYAMTHMARCIALHWDAFQRGFTQPLRTQ